MCSPAAGTPTFRRLQPTRSPAPRCSVQPHLEGLPISRLPRARSRLCKPARRSGGIATRSQPAAAGLFGGPAAKVAPAFPFPAPFVVTSAVGDQAEERCTRATLAREDHESHLQLVARLRAAQVILRLRAEFTTPFECIGVDESRPQRSSGDRVHGRVGRMEDLIRECRCGGDERCAGDEYCSQPDAACAIMASRLFESDTTTLQAGRHRSAGCWSGKRGWRGVRQLHPVRSVGSVPTAWPQARM